MNNVTTPETAAKLKAAGFPQPEYAKGQFWYDADGEVFAAIGLNKDGNAIGTYLQKSGYFGGCNTDSEDSFAPTATDILRELPNKTLLYFCEKWQCGTQYDDDPTDIWGFEHLGTHDNPAEAAALAWLEVNKK